jgi:hypothetical protein
LFMFVCRLGKYKREESPDRCMLRNNRFRQRGARLIPNPWDSCRSTLSHVITCDIRYVMMPSASMNGWHCARTDLKESEQPTSCEAQTVSRLRREEKTNWSHCDIDGRVSIWNPL